MKRTKYTISIFLSFVRAGLWEREVRLGSFDGLVFQDIYRLAQEQALVGLVAAGMEKTIGERIPKEVALMFVGEALQLEQRNAAMNYFIAVIVEKMRDAGIYSLLIKGQGIAQCYERPLWRSSGDIDFLLSASNYSQAKAFLTPLASKVEDADEYKLHLPLTIDPWLVELHGTLRGGLWNRIDRTLDSVQEEIFFSGAVRSWLDGDTQVFLPRQDEDVVFVFTHILQHFFRGGIGLRQVCDWCRLIWTYREAINKQLLEKRLREMRVMSEWRAFSALAVDSLGMPSEAMPFYSSKNKWSRKANKILSFILETGNFGHNRDYSYYQKYPFLVYKTISLWRHTKDGFLYFSIFPLDSIKVWCGMVEQGIKEIFKKH